MISLQTKAIFILGFQIRLGKCWPNYTGEYEGGPPPLPHAGTDCGRLQLLALAVGAQGLPPSSHTLHPWVLDGGWGRMTRQLNSTRSIRGGGSHWLSLTHREHGFHQKTLAAPGGPPVHLSPSGPERQGKGLQSPSRGGTSVPNPGPTGKSCPHFLTYCLCGWWRQRS